MSSSRDPPQPMASGLSDPSDSDDDLDLNELDASGSGMMDNMNEYGKRNQSGSWRGPGIALRNLRRGARRRWDRDADREHGEDLSSLLHDQEENWRSSQGGLSGEDDAPLLSNRDEYLLPPEGKREQRVSSGSRFRFLQRFRSNSSIRLPTDDPSQSRTRGTKAEKSSTQEVLVGQPQQTRYPANIVSNAKYTPWSFLPRTLYNEFSFFFNIYFLLVALSQIIPILRIGYMSSYIAPLVFVVSISLGKEALDDIARRRRDAEANSEEFKVMSFDVPGTGQRPLEITKKSRDLKVGDILKIRKDQRLPADVIFLKSVPTESTLSNDTAAASEALPPLIEEEGTSDAAQGSSGAQQPVSNDTSVDSGSSDTFIRTDQLDGETDWKLRIPPVLTQSLPLSEFNRIRITAGAPDKSVNEFIGKIELRPPGPSPYDTPQPEDSSQKSSGAKSLPLGIDNTAWANTVLASNTTTFAAVIYTGCQTRSALSTSASRSKVGLLEYEINSLTKILCVLTLSLSIILVVLEGFESASDKEWYISIMIYLILFSTIIPMSLRVNLDMAKSVYGRFIERDQGIPGTVVRTSTIPEDLGRIEYLLSDKTGTLTQNGE